MLYSLDTENISIKEQNISKISDFSPKNHQSNPKQVENPQEEFMNKVNQIKEAQEKDKQKEKENSTDNLLNIEYVKKIILKGCPKFNEKFELLEPINSGSTGAVFKGKYKNSKKFFAFKIMKEKRNEKPKNIKDYKEVLIHKNLHYKNIPELHGFFPLNQNHSCMIMDYNIYGDLESFKRKTLKRICLSETLISFISGNIIEGLAYLNRNNIIHLDIKQQNILVDEFLNIKITDFSVSMKYDTKKPYIDLPMVGTCYYMSPEVLASKRILVSEASKIDIYSFGVLLYVLAFNDYPYELDNVDHKNYKEILKNIEEKELVFPKGTGHSDLFINFLKKCLEKDIKKRYNIYQVMNDPWMKSYQIILNEKNNLYNAGKFMIEMLVDSIKPFNDYVKPKDK